MKNQSIEWISKKVAVLAIAPTPTNYKIKTALGKERLRESLKSFGLAGTVVCNYAKKFGDLNNLILIDGNSRREDAIEQGIKQIWVSLPSRLLTADEFREMSAMFDFAKASEVDMSKIEKDLGTKEAFYKKYHMEVPMELMEKLGANAPNIKEQEEEKKITTAKDEFMIVLYYDKKDMDIFRKIEAVVMKKYKTLSTSETVLKALKTIE